MDDTKFRDVAKKHSIAIEYLLLGQFHEKQGKSALSQLEYRFAYEIEHTNALKMRNFHLEPLRSDILLTAANLAIKFNECREAEKLIASALAGDPPPSIANELRDLLMQIVP